MGFYKEEDIRGVFDEGGIICMECAPDVWQINKNEEDLITEGDVEKGDKFYFCDECGKGL